MEITDPRPGPSCKDTKDFVAAANLLGEKTYLVNCQLQLTNTTLNFDSIDYGFTLGDVNYYYGQRLTTAGGIVMGVLLIFAGILSVIACCGNSACSVVAGICIVLGLVVGVPLLSYGEKYMG